MGPKAKQPAACKRCGRLSQLCREYCKSCHSVLRRQGKLDVLAQKVLPNELNDIQRQVLLGSLLGDGCLYRRKETHKPYFVVLRQQADRAYLDWEANIFGDFVSSIREGKVFDKRTNKTYERCSFLTHRTNVFLPFYNQWYYKGKKALPEELTLTPTALAVWFADDGFVRPSCSPWRLRLKLATQGFDKNEVERLTDMLAVRYGEKFNVIKSDEHYVIDSSDAATRAFCREIDDQFPESMLRKAYWREPRARFYENQPTKNRLKRQKGCAA